MRQLQKKVRLAIVGAGSRGTAYAGYALENPQELAIVAVAEPRTAYREALVAQHKIERMNVFKNWQTMIHHKKIADAVVIATQDSDHVLPTIAFARSRLSHSAGEACRSEHIRMPSNIR